jgi:tetratricopeptide (TPR) repeat protein
MNLTDASDPQLRPPPAQVELALAAIESSTAFRSSARHRALLRYLVAQALGPAAPPPKESVIAVEVFGRAPGRFDPRSDSIVRVEARRLRARLAAYYAAEGREMPVRIELPVGSYLPLLASRTAQAGAELATRRARDLVERGEHFLRQALTPAAIEQALARFDEALRESPDYAPACVGLARAWLNLATGWYREPAVAADHAAEALRRALALDPNDATAHALLGALQHQFEQDWPAAERSFRRAIAIAPRLAFVHSAYGYHLTARGEAVPAERELMLARQLDPQYVNSRLHMVNLRIQQGRLDQAQAEVDALHDIAPDAMAVVGMRGAIAMFRGDAPAAIAHYRRAAEIAPDHPGCLAALAAAQGLAGRPDEADATIEAMHRRFPDRVISPYLLAIVAARCGRVDRAFELLDEALRHRDPNIIFLPDEPSFAALRGDARWAALRQRQRPQRGRARADRADAHASAARVEGHKTDTV